MDLVVPECCMEQVRKQRTQCAGMSDPAATWAKSICQDWRAIANALPTPCRRVIDIGCGLAGIDVLLWRHCQPTLYLFDRDAMERRPRYGYSTTPSAYCLHEQTGALLASNGVPADDYVLTTSFPRPPARVDLVLSLISWGFHYPVDTYLDAVAAVLRPGGRLVIDLRTETVPDAIEQLRSAIGPVCHCCWASAKQTRVILNRRVDA